MIAVTSHREEEYLLQLAAGLGWRLTATGKARPWLDELAGIMELKKGHSAAYPKVVFCRNEFGKEALKDLIASPGGGNGNGRGLFDHWSPRVKSKVVFDLWMGVGRPDMIFDLGETGTRELEFLKMAQAVSEMFVHACAKGGIPFHAALVEHGGKGILLAAPSNTGKSTCARRIPEPWGALCDDRALVMKDGRGGYLVHPFPTWSEYMCERSTPTWGVEHPLPLSAVFFLGQAEKDQALPLEKVKAVACTLLSVRDALYWVVANYSPEERKQVQERVFLNACEMVKTVPAYILKVSLGGRFWEKMEKALGETGLAGVV
jgi:SynChlorMet cassette protein ScmC